MKTKTRAILVGTFLLLALTALGAATLNENNHFYHSNSITATGVSQLVSTTKMRMSICDAWLFKNRSSTGTLYLNVNVADGYNGDAVVSDVNMVVVEPNETIELEDAVVKRFSVISDSEAELYWLCACK